MDKCGGRVGRARVHDTRAALVRLIATLVLGPLLLLDLVLVLVGLSPGATGGCGPRQCQGALTTAPALGPLCWLVAVVSLVIAVCLPGRSAFRTARAVLLLTSATCGLVALIVLAVVPPAG
jgi:hypothetical protein